MRSQTLKSARRLKIGSSFVDLMPDSRRIDHPVLPRKELSAAKVHTEPVAGISGSKRDGAYSVVLSGAYEDDKDNGETL